MVNDGRGGRETEILVVVATLTASLALFGNWLLALVACCYWQSAPPRFGARALALAGLVLIVLVMMRTSNALLTLTRFQGFREEREFIIPTLILSLVFEVCRLTLLALFIRAVGRKCGRTSQATHGRVLALGTPFLVLQEAAAAHLAGEPGQVGPDGGRDRRHWDFSGGRDVSGAAGLGRTSAAERTQPGALTTALRDGPRGLWRIEAELIFLSGFPPPSWKK